MITNMVVKSSYIDIKMQISLLCLLILKWYRLHQSQGDKKCRLFRPTQKHLVAIHFGQFI